MKSKLSFTGFEWHNIYYRVRENRSPALRCKCETDRKMVSRVPVLSKENNPFLRVDGSGSAYLCSY